MKIIKDRIVKDKIIDTSYIFRQQNINQGIWIEDNS